MLLANVVVLMSWKFCPDAENRKAIKYWKLKRFQMLKMLIILLNFI